MRYKCLVLDHDDTAVRSTPAIHHPSFAETVKVLRPGRPVPTLSEFIEMSCHRGFAAYCYDVMQFTDAEMEIEQEIWRKWTQREIPDPYPGMAEAVAAFRGLGGIVCVASHSEADTIRRDYRRHFGGEPEMVFGWEQPPEKRKPNPYALDEIMKTYGLAPPDLLMVDDLRPGLEMAAARGVDFCWAAWSETAPVVGEFMRKNAKYAFETPWELGEFVMGAPLVVREV